MTIDKLNKTIKKFWQSKGYSEIYFNGRCADFAWALRQFLGTGQLYMIGGIFHVVLKYNNHYCDIKGCHPENKLLFSSPIGLNKNGVKPANSSEIQHIKSLLNKEFVSDTIAGLRKASKGA